MNPSKFMQSAVLVLFSTVLLLMFATDVLAQKGQKKKSPPPPPQTKWIQLFNGKDLTGWTAKIRGHELGDNYADTFRVVDGKLVVSYDKYTEADSMSVTDPKNQRSTSLVTCFIKTRFHTTFCELNTDLWASKSKMGPIGPYETMV